MHYDDDPFARVPRTGTGVTFPGSRMAILAALAIGAAVLSAMGKEAAGPAIRFGIEPLRTGVRYHYAEQGPAGGEPIILLHGYSDSWFSWSRVMPLFPAEWRVFALDQRGQGDSDRPAGGYGMADIAADVIAFMDAKEIRRATIVGHSMGGFVAQQVARLAPDRVTRLVLVATGGNVREINGSAEFEAAVMALTDPVPEAFAREFQVSTIHRPLPPEFVDRTVVESLKLPAHVWHGLMRGMLATPPAELAGARFPTLLLWGDRDAIFPRSAQDGLQARIPGARLLVFPETGHAVHWERPEEVARELREFVGSSR
jgi:pimeloyl-ACP methyl ester carboxylesterase